MTKTQANNIVSLSGGKDSTAMLLMMIEQKVPIHSVVFFDTGWEFPEMYDHIRLVEKITGLKVWTLNSKLPFLYWMTARPMVSTKKVLSQLEMDKIIQRWNVAKAYNDLPTMPTTKKGIINILAGKIYRVGNGWPSSSRRWCTRQKVDSINLFCKPIPNSVSMIGYAADEENRIKDNGKIPQRYPLVELGITEAEALQYCYDKGFNWGGLYEVFGRVSCFCCPLQRVGELRKLRSKRPELWQKTLEMEAMIPNNRGFKDYKTVADYERRFNFEDRQMLMFEKSG